MVTNGGTINVHRTLSGSGAAFQVTFAPHEMKKESTSGVRRFSELQQVRAFLKLLGIEANSIREAVRQLAAGRSASVPGVVLSDEILRREGLETTAMFRRSKG
jgi:hypothetical protein